MERAGLFGSRFTAADAYLFVTLRWARQFGVDSPAALGAYHDEVAGRRHVRSAFAEEGLLDRPEPAAVRRKSASRLRTCPTRASPGGRHSREP